MSDDDSREDLSATDVTGWARRSQQACVVLAVLGTISVLYLAKAAVAPVLFAIVFALLLSPAVDGLRRWRIPRALASALVVIALVTAVSACANAIWDPARAWLDQAPATMRILERKLKPLTRFIAKVESVSDQAGRMTEPAIPAAARSAPVTPAESSNIVAGTQHLAITVITTLILTYFMLASGPALLARWSRDPHTDTSDRRMLLVAETVRTELGRYFGAVALSNLFLGSGTALAMYLLDMPNPVLWGILAFTLNFVPYAGSAVTFVLLTVVALVSFDGVGKAVAVATAYLGLATFEGQILQPILVGRRLDVSPIFVFLGLWFGGWLWGIAGIALAVPLMVAIKAVWNAAHRDDPIVDPAQSVASTTMRGRASEWLAHPYWRHRRSLRDES
jgi:predicted PurR-regulated permease PerM